MEINDIEVLKRQNPHERDAFILFYEENHKYVITNDPNSNYTSVTTWIHKHFEQFDADKVIQNMTKKTKLKYKNMTNEEIKKSWELNGQSARELGTNFHYNIECFMNSSNKPNITHKDLLREHTDRHTEQTEKKEWQFFLNFIRDFPDMKPYRTEWTVYDDSKNIKLAGSIDMVYENEDGTLSIYDWKRAKEIVKISAYNKFALSEAICHLPDTNYWHYALQLNMYKYILEKKYGKKVRDLYLVCCHPDSLQQNYELIALPDLSGEIKELYTG